MTNTDELSSISHELKLSELDGEARHVSLEANEADRKAVAEQFDIRSVELLKGDFDVTRHASLVRVAGSVEAVLGRTCVVSLEPMEEKIAEDFTAEFTTERHDVDGEEVEADLDAPEPIDGDAIELRNVLLEQVVLAMSPHPRKEGAEAPEDPGTGEGSNPFDVLKSLRD
ncbi:DUF177 domain-containing protein [Parvularcula sp. ZS-1/3]|uniref:DUF177 domain-containing protein n=1 Tax=Parvularcula mediterranea TaxID=2732508 RepID=A0A7Y3W5Z8_9PROT|nr:DUF177 domain-containing protein [Parvularcula mediterranea]NNU16791.1 DUF177 domain-containing protein [Parvularcula mediterranea]